MSIPLMTATILGTFIVLLLIGIPIAFCLIGTSLIFAAIFIDPAIMYTVYSNAFRTITQEVFVAVPLFVFMATILQNSGIGSALYEVLYKWFAGVRGGLAVGTIILCTLIAAMTGLGATGVVTIGYLGFPEMEKRGYDRSISLGCIPPGGALGPLIPPSVLMIVLGGFAHVSVGRLFIGGIFPGLLMAFLFIIYITIRCWHQPRLAPAMPPEDRSSWKDKVISLRGVILPITLILMVLGTIYAGIATPSEAGGVGAFGALISAAIYRRLSWKNLREATFMAAKIVAMVMWLVIGGSAFSSILLAGGINHFISDSITSLAISPMVVLLIMMVIPFLMGMFMDGGAIMMILIPIFMPVVTLLGIDPLWFSLLFTINIVIGYVTPPFGFNLFYTKGITPDDVTMADIYRAVIPFVVIMVVTLVLCVIFPPILTWLPNRMIG
ncbi:C4-dicarboxylate TRAP transporter large permease protein DctM [subsurface metagenome]